LSLKISPKRLGNLLSLVSNNTISANAAKKVFDLVEESNKDPETIIEEQGLKQISNLQVLEDVVHEIIARNTEEVARYKAGEGKLMGFFVGEAMKTTKGNGNPREINKLFSKFLESVAQ
jgi:Asp-tRNA(Asn)/Glu-tRNA(Gln) amidotransferase B subunit